MGEESTLPELTGSQGLEQFVLLAKTVTGTAAAQLIQDATQANGMCMRYWVWVILKLSLLIIKWNLSI